MATTEKTNFVNAAKWLSIDQRRDIMKEFNIRSNQAFNSIMRGVYKNWPLVNKVVEVAESNKKLADKSSQL